MKDTMEIAELSKWVGKTETRSDQLTAAPVAALSATLDRDDPAPRDGDAVPPLWHWLWFWPIHRQSELGPEGHPITGSFMPPVPLPRRMWAGSRFEFHHPLRIGECATRTSRVVDVRRKEGRSGALVFVVARHEIRDDAGVALHEERDIVYRGPGNAAAAPQAAPRGRTWERIVHADEVLLFRYSALTFNGHRIHYDHRYAKEVEGYPGLVVHGPLIATLLVDLLRDHLPERQLTSFAFRAVGPLFDTSPFRVCGAFHPDGKTVHLWAEDMSGNLAMTATAALR
jgi:3-methylfumaryl-CoA hydratase